MSGRIKPRLGVPQMRQRIIFVGVREDLAIDPVHPEPLRYRYSVRDALPETMLLDGKARSVYDVLQEPGLSKVLSDEVPIPEMRALMKAQVGDSPCDRL